MTRLLLGLALLGLVGCASATDEDASGSASALQQSRPRVLVVMSSANAIDLAAGGTTKAGVYLAEIATPVGKMLDAGADVTVVSPGGGRPTLDDVSDDAKWFGGDARVLARARTLFARSDFQHPGRLEDVTAAALDGFDAVFVPGGHAPMNDLHASAALAHVLEHQHAAHKLTGAICHGTSGLLAPAANGAPWIYAGYRLTGYSAVEEDLGVLLHYVGGKPALRLQSELSKAGADYSQSLVPFTSHVVRDRELLTGQDPQSTEDFGDQFVAALVAQHNGR